MFEEVVRRMMELTFEQGKSIVFHGNVRETRDINPVLSEPSGWIHPGAVEQKSQTQTRNFAQISE